MNTERAIREYSIEGYAEDLLLWLCGQQNMKNPVIVGQSMGGNMALEIAARSLDFPVGIVPSLAEHRFCISKLPIGSPISIFLQNFARNSSPSKRSAPAISSLEVPEQINPMIDRSIPLYVRGRSATSCGETH